MIQTYEKKPLQIEAVRWDGLRATYEEIGPWIKGNLYLENEGRGFHEGDSLWIKTLEGTLRCDIGDYIIKGIRGEFYPCKPSVFELTYTLVIK